MSLQEISSLNPYKNRVLEHSTTTIYFEVNNSKTKVMYSTSLSIIFLNKVVLPHRSRFLIYLLHFRCRLVACVFLVGQFVFCFLVAEFTCV